MTASLRAAAHWPFIGRESELARMAAALRRHPEAAGIVLAGDAGVGKTRRADGTCKPRPQPVPMPELD